MIGRLVLGLGLAAAGAAVLLGMTFIIYNHQASRLMVDLGIPGSLLITLAGLTLVFSGAAIALRANVNR